jgi:RNA polymerase sigma-70 factor (ECF subfamily)
MTRDAYNTLFEGSYSSLCNYAYAIIKDYDEAEDIVQGVFVNFWNNEKKDELVDKAKQYLVRSVKFKCIDYQRKQIVKRKHEKEILHTQEDIVQSEVIEETDTSMKDALMLAIAELPEKTREVFMLSKLDGLSYREIAEHFEISPKTVENQMGRAFRHLREKLHAYKELLVVILFLTFE